MTPPGDNPTLLCQDCSRPLFRWFMTRAGWKGLLAKQGLSGPNVNESPTYSRPPAPPRPPARQLETCWGLTFMCAELSRKCRAAGVCVLTPPQAKGTKPDVGA